MAKVRSLKDSKPKNDELRIIVKEEIFKNQLELIKEKQEEFNFKVKKTQSKVKGKVPAHIILELLDEESDPKKMIRLGSALEALKFKAAADKREENYEKKKKEVKLKN